MYFVKAGHRTISLDHLVMAEDEKDEPQPKRLPPGVLRVTMINGRALDFEGESAEVMRLQLGLVTLNSPQSSARTAVGGADAPTESPFRPSEGETMQREKGNL